MSNRSVVRNQAYQKKGISIRERHNERENETYYNADIQTDKKHLYYFNYRKADSEWKSQAGRVKINNLTAANSTVCWLSETEDIC